MSLTSPQPLAEVTRRTQRFIFPPPLPLCVDRDPERTAVSEVVRGACQTKTCMNIEHKGDGSDIMKCSIVHPDLNGLGNVHPVDLNMGKTSSWYILKVLLISIEEVCCIYANAYCPLNEDK